MTWKRFFTSSIGKKYIMGFTGLFLSGIVSCAWDLYGFYLPIYGRQIGLTAGLSEDTSARLPGLES